MNATSQQQLGAVRDEHGSWLRQQPGYTGSFLGRDKDGKPILVLQFHPVTPEMRQSITKKFEGYPVEIRDIPMARAF